MMPATLSIITVSFPAEERGRRSAPGPACRRSRSRSAPWWAAR
jgi:hypothetical protein